MPRFRVEFQGASGLKTDMEDVQRQLDDLRWDAWRVRTALSFRIKTRENIAESLRRIEGALEAQSAFANLLARCGQDSMDVYRTAEQSVLREYGVDVPDEMPLWQKVLLGKTALTLIEIGMMCPPMMWVEGTLLWGAYARVAEDDEDSLLHREIDWSHDVLGIPISIRGDMDVLGYERDVNGHYDVSEVISYLFRSNLEIQVGDFYEKNMGLNFGGTGSYMETNADDAWRECGILGLVLALGAGGLSGEAFGQAYLINYHMDERVGSEQYNIHRSRDSYLGEAHGQIGLAVNNDFEGANRGAEVDIGASGIKGVENVGITYGGDSMDVSMGADMVTKGVAAKKIFTDDRFEVGAGVGEVIAALYVGLKFTSGDGSWTPIQEKLLSLLYNSTPG